jgi:hypothetical protein
MADSAIDYVNLTRICEFTPALRQVHQIGGDEAIDREFNVVCRAILRCCLPGVTKPLARGT